MKQKAQEKMPSYIATFHTHLSAMRTQRALFALGVNARLAPVPRKLSASCGTCVRYDAEEPLLAQMDVDVEQVVLFTPDGDAYERLLYNE